ncbi:shikimate kinase [Flavobacterium croceum DSM 17960]|uniref:Shikimate kinase n=1 Tax=Flavobacterium croceum DSM 17960 TaxID=1121886 RepID=A0A2S4N7X4_9FLAO|nr:shikimate kinase [Flavobacterium croceum]POS01798.1 shikimate kinase [Flavobacterium croceum DSM 17960]
MKKIVLLGYMGSGKSTIGSALASAIGLPYLDLDHQIEQLSQKTVSEIFETKGEIYFRRLESQLFNELLNNNENFVLSLGGGTPCYYNHDDLLQKDGVTSIYLKVSVPILYQRLLKEKEQRPLLARLDDEELQEFIAKHLFEREPYYRKAKHIINCNDISVANIVSEIENKLR